MNKKGQCICGSVRVTAKSPAEDIGACHCGTCRRWGGGPLLAIDCGTDFAFDDDSAVATYDSSEWADRGFCNKCGTHLFYRLKESGQYIVPIGLFNDADGMTFGHQVFVDEKPDYYDFANETKNMTGAELFAMFGATQ